MPQVRIPEGFAELVIKSTNADNSNPIVNVMGIGYDVGEPIQDVLDQIQIAFVEFAENFTENITTDEVVVRLGAAAAPYIAIPVAINVVGTISGAPTSPNEAVLVKKSGNLAGRHGQGRNYWYGMVTDADVDGGGTIASGTVTAVQAACTTLNSQLIVAPLLGMFILHQDDYVGTPTTVFGYTVQSRMATQRRRLR